MELKVLGTDEFKNEFVVFYIDNGDDLNAYVWVYDDGDIKITDIYGLARYCNHAVSPIYVGDDMPEEFVDEARKKLSEMDSEKRKELVDGFNKRIEQLKKNEEEYKEREEYEDGCIEDIENENNVSDGMFWFM